MLERVRQATSSSCQAEYSLIVSEHWRSEHGTRRSTIARADAFLAVDYCHSEAMGSRKNGLPKLATGEQPEMG